MHKSIYIFLLLLPLLVGGCNPEEATPAYLYIAPFTVDIDTPTQGSSSSRITEAWVTADGLFLGAYALPALVPVLGSGTVEVRVEAGVRENGISVTPDIYPFYAPVLQTLELVPGQTDTIRPVARYADNTKFAFIEDFEEARPRIFGAPTTGEGGIVRVRENALEGEYAGRILLTTSNPVVEVATINVLPDLVANNINVALEVNYRADAPVIFGLVGEQQGQVMQVFDPGFLPRPEWTKIYFNLAPLVFESRLSSYRLVLRAFRQDDSPAEAEILLDNIKLLYF